VNNNPAPQQGTAIRQLQKHLKNKHFELGNKLPQIKTFHSKSVDPDSITRSYRSAIFKSYENCRAKKEKNKIFAVNQS